MSQSWLLSLDILSREVLARSDFKCYNGVKMIFLGGAARL